MGIAIGLVIALIVWDAVARCCSIILGQGLIVSFGSCDTVGVRATLFVWLTSNFVHDFFEGRHFICIHLIGTIRMIFI